MTLTKNAPRAATTSSYRNSFSTMASLQSAHIPAATGPRSYDPEIDDIANYVHNTPVNSELAVSAFFLAALFFSAMKSLPAPLPSGKKIHPAKSL